MKRVGIGVLGALLALLAPAWSSASAACPSPPASEAQPWLNPAYPADCRAQFVVAALPTMPQKVAALTSATTFTGMGIVTPAGNDGPAGDVRGNGVSQFPAPIALGATWNRAAAERYGDAIGEEYRARNKSMVGGPVVDLMRTWHQGRQAEGFGEDPFLTSQIVAPEIGGIQANHVAAMTKHLGAYSQETGRAGDAPTTSGANSPTNFPNDEQISLKALNELYLAPFGAAAEAGTSLYMCAFPAVNGHFACEDDYVMNKMRAEYGFQGAIGPDFPNAQHSLAASLNAGCDNCSATFGGSTLQAEVDAGRVPVSTLDRMIYDKVVASFRIGLTDNPPAGAANTADVRSAAHDAVTRDVATDGAVLLKNAGAALPLASGTDSIAVIGPSASAAPVYAVGGSAYVPPVASALVTPLKGIQDRAPAGTTINYAQGAAAIGQQPDAPELPLFTLPFSATYFGTPDWTGPAVLSQTETGVNLNAGIPNPSVAPGASNGNGGTIKANGWSARYSGTFSVPTSGLYVFSLGDGGAAKLYVDGVLKAQTLDGQFGFATQVALDFSAGQSVALRVDYTPREAAPGIIGPTQIPLTVAPTIKIGPYVHLGMTGPDSGAAAPDKLIADAVNAAKASKVAVVFVSEASGEGVDRATLALPGAQDRLVSAVAAANPNTIVVLNTGGPVLMPWLGQVKGALEVWYPGDQFGRSTAALLFGDATPNGRLPQTWPASEAQGPGQTAASFPGVLFPNTTTPTAWKQTFDEGVLIGYRYYDAHAQAPLFGFGYGLSYTSFAYGPLSVAGHGDGTFTASVKVTNTGAKAGAEVPQLYVKFPDAAGEAPWNLKGFDKVVLSPGESRTMSFPLSARSVRSYSVSADAWQVVPGWYTLAVGSASRDLRDQLAFDPSQPGYSATSAPGTVGGTVPATLSLTLGAAASFGPFTPGATKDYTASTSANVISTAGDAALTVSDPGHLTNGAFSLLSPLEVSFSKTTWTAPVSNDPVSIAFKQHIDATDPLRTGTYSRTLTFTLSTTTP